MLGTKKEKSIIPSNRFFIFLVIGLLFLTFSPVLSVASATANSNSLSEKTTQTTSTSDTGGTIYYASSKSDVFHLSTCYHVKQIKTENLISFNSIQEAEANDYRPCKDCLPELAELINLPLHQHLLQLQLQLQLQLRHPLRQQLLIQIYLLLQV